MVSLLTVPLSAEMVRPLAAALPARRARGASASGSLERGEVDVPGVETERRVAVARGDQALGGVEESVLGPRRSHQLERAWQARPGGVERAERDGDGGRVHEVAR